MKRIIAALGICVSLLTAPRAQAGIDGSVPSPGGCDYPATGIFGASFGEYDFACQYPVEINGSRHTTLFGGGMWLVQAGVSFTLVLGVNVSVTTPAGVLRGISYFACPDFSVSADPNPPGAWKNEIRPSPCKTIAPRPQLIRDGEQPQPPPLAPAQPALAPAPQPALPTTTDPTQGNSYTAPDGGK